MPPRFLSGADDRGGPAFLLLGEVLRPHGLRGEVKLRLLTDYPERIDGMARVFLAPEVQGRDARAWKVEHMRMHQRHGLLKLEGVDDRDAAELLRDLKLLVPVDEAVPLEEGEFYLYQLLGLRVVTAEGCELGTIRDVIETGANDVYVVRGASHGEVLIPATPETVLETNIAGGTLLVQLPDGLLTA